MKGTKLILLQRKEPHNLETLECVHKKIYTLSVRDFINDELC